MHALLALSFCAFRVAVAADEHGHEHGEGAFEWAGIFEVPDDVYMWTAQKVDGSYVDPAMKMVVLPATAATDAALEGLEAEAKHAMEGNCTEVEANDVIMPMEDHCYHLHFDEDLWQTLYRIDTSSTPVVAFFTEHFPTEFENTAHYLKDSTGEDIEPMAEHPHQEDTDEHDHVDWGSPIGAAILVNIVTLIGVFLILPVCGRLAEANAAVFEGVLCSFAAGALIACAVFLLLFEATHLVGEGYTEETDIIWRWGTMVLLGFFIPSVVDTAAGLWGEARSQKNADSQDGTEVADVGEVRSRARLISSVLLGDFMHNLCDGFFIGAAFSGCGTSFGWGVTVGTVLHELPQELADYAILTGSLVKLRPVKALALNFISGLSVVLGVIIVNASDVGNPATGMLLAFGGGVYVYIAAAECMPKVHSLNLPAKMHIVTTLCFVIGAVLIGLILLDHEHCIPEGGDGHGHHDHGHGH